MQGSAPSTSRVDRIRRELQLGFETTIVEVIDDSHMHVGHAGARDGKGHFRVRVVSDKFAGLRPVQRHKLVYQVLDQMMHTDIHALGVTALTVDEAARERT